MEDYSWPFYTNVDANLNQAPAAGCKIELGFILNHSLPKKGKSLFLLPQTNTAFGGHSPA